jgi:L-seryl-tRNA(Ser) seleniumtransferase
LQVDIDDAVLGVGAATVARVLGQRNPAIIVRNHEVELGYFQLDPCNLLPGQAESVATALRDVLCGADAMTAAPGDFDIARNGSTKAYLEWGKA